MKKYFCGLIEEFNKTLTIILSRKDLREKATLDTIIILLYFLCAILQKK